MRIIYQCNCHKHKTPKIYFYFYVILENLLRKKKKSALKNINKRSSPCFVFISFGNYYGK
jgi:hypothetical protein